MKDALISGNHQICRQLTEELDNLLRLYPKLETLKHNRNITLVLWHQCMFYILSICGERVHSTEIPEEEINSHRVPVICTVINRINTGPPSWSSQSDRGDHQQKTSKLCCEEIQGE